MELWTAEAPFGIVGIDGGIGSGVSMEVVNAIEDVSLEDGSLVAPVISVLWAVHGVKVFTC